MKELKPLTLGGQLLERPIIISGPCSAETEEQTLETAKGLCANGIKIFRSHAQSREALKGWERKDWPG